MKIFLFKNQNGVFYLVPAEEDAAAVQILQSWRPGVYSYCGETLEFTACPVKRPIAMLEVDFKVQLPEINLGLQTAAIEFAKPTP